jgi:hypothetical protein
MVPYALEQKALCFHILSENAFLQIVYFRITRCKSTRNEKRMTTGI